MTRIDHIDDPLAPPPNSLVPSAVVFVENDRAQVLLIQRSDNGDWALPGGGHDLGERIVDTAIREAKEETGLDVKVTGLIGTYTNPNHLVEYTSDGEVRQQFALSFRAVVTGGTLTTSPESTKVEWFARSELEALSINRGMRRRIDHGFEHRTEPYLE